MARIEQRSQEWLDLRRTKLGASDAAAVMGVSPWTTPYQLWLEKTGRIPPKAENDAMRRGKLLEDEAREYFGEQLGVVFFDDVKVCEIPGYEFMMASLDGIDLDKEIAIEIKCPMKKGNGEIPIIYQWQMIHQMFVYGLGKEYYGEYHPKSECEPILYHECADMTLEYLDKASQFWEEYVLKDIPPPMTDKDFEHKYDTVFDSLADSWIWSKERLIRAQEEEKEFREALLKLCDKNCTNGAVKCQKITRKGSIDYENIPELQGLDLEKYRKESSEYWKISMEGEDGV